MQPPARLARGWTALFALGILAAGAYMVLPYSSISELVLYDGVVALAVVVSFVGWRRSRPGGRLPWLYSSAALLAFLIGELLWWGYSAAGQDPFPSAADAFFVGGYIPLAIAAGLLASSWERESDRTAWLDAGILMAVAGLLIWDVLMEPSAHDSSVGPLTLAVTMAYPLADLLVLGLVVRLLFSRSVRDRAVTMFIWGLALTLTADLAFAWQDLSDSFSPGSWIDVAWLSGYLLIAFAPLHPDNAPAAQIDAREGMGRWRLIVVLAAVAIPPAVLLNKLAVRDLIGLDTLTVAACVSLVVMALVAARLWGLLERARRSEEQRGSDRLAALIHHSADGIFLVNEDLEITFASPAARELCGKDDERWEGRSLLDVFVDNGRPIFARPLRNLVTMPTGAILPLEGRSSVNGVVTTVVEGTACNLLADASVRGIVVTLRDVTSRHELEEQLNRRAFHDDLTGLPNRALLTDRVSHALNRSARSGDSTVAMLFIDLDDFKTVNDGLGHDAGDTLLRGVAARIQAGLRPGDTVARFGGDEFAVLLEDVPSLDYAREIGARILELLQLPLELDTVSLAVAASVGVTLATADSTVDSLLRDADIAMYTAKYQGKRRVVVFDESLREIASRRLALKIELPEALRAGQFRLEYQPIFMVADGVLSGFEALIRWHHPERGVLLPIEFIAAAEETGAIIDIGQWVIEEACDQAVVWNQRSAQPLTIAVNVSPVQMHDPGFNDVVRDVLETTGLPPSLLTLELTESILAENARVEPVLAELRELGVRIAIDDFGTGYSSLAYLQSFPATSIKIDRSFIAELSARGDGGLISGILSMAEALGLETVAEGIESESQLDALKLFGCQLAQGYMLGLPQATAAIDRLVDDQTRLEHPDPFRHPVRTTD